MRWREHEQAEYRVTFQYTIQGHAWGEYTWTFAIDERG
ncbi:MAG: hypothetical protein OJF49_001585 [Ktedonobacterales bacterium]|nr:MAG: hypothetical protein OJF49_001585 [Ktedonobacterales bacterium]